MNLFKHGLMLATVGAVCISGVVGSKVQAKDLTAFGLGLGYGVVGGGYEGPCLNYVMGVRTNSIGEFEWATHLGLYAGVTSEVYWPRWWSWTIGGGFDWFVRPLTYIGLTFPDVDVFPDDDLFGFWGVGAQTGVEYNFNENGAPLILSVNMSPRFNILKARSLDVFSLSLSVDLVWTPSNIGIHGTHGTSSGIADGNKSHNSQVQTLVKVGDTYFDEQNFSESESKYNMAIQIYERYRKTSTFDVANVVRAYFRVGEIYYKKFEGIELTAENEKEMDSVIRTKKRTSGRSTSHFTTAVNFGMNEYASKGTYMIGKSYYDMAEAVANQTLFGNDFDQFNNKIKLIVSRHDYYAEAIEKFKQNITWAKKRNIKDEYIELSMQAIMEMAYKKGAALEELGLLLKDAPMSKGLTEKETHVLRNELNKQSFQSLVAAINTYELGMELAKKLGIAKSPWIDRIRERLVELKPKSRWKDVKIVEWKPKER